MFLPATSINTSANYFLSEGREFLHGKKEKFRAKIFSSPAEKMIPRVSDHPSPSEIKFPRVGEEIKRVEIEMSPVGEEKKHVEIKIPHVVKHKNL